MRKRILTLTLAVLMCAGLLPAAVFGAEFKFIDVSPEAWYYSDVKNAVESGLVNGKTETTYCPDDLLTYAEAVKLAACMYQKYTTGVVSLVNGDPWYKSYADYAKMNGIITADYEWNEKATRAGYMAIFAHALPDAALTVKNEVPDGSIPDVPMTHPQAKEIYKLYRAGILQGSDDMYLGVWTKHLCKPADNIKRSEVAAILTRMMYVPERQSFSMGTTEAVDTLKIVKNPVSTALKAVNETVSFTVDISGGKAPYIYKWVIEKETGTTPTSATSEKLTSTYNVTFSKDSFAFTKTIYIYCVVTDSDGKSVQSEKASVTPYSDTLRVVKQPENYVVKKAGDTDVSFGVEIAGGKGPYLYDWHEELADRTVSLQQTTSETKSIMKVTDADAVLEKNPEVTVFCIITDSTGAKVTTDKVKLTKTAIKAYIDPTAVTLASSSETFTLKTAVTGGVEPYKYQWFWGTAADKLSDMSEWADGYTTPNLTAKPDPRYDVQYMSCRVTDADGNEAFTPVVSISVKTGDALKITKQPEDRTAWVSETVTFSVEVSGGTKPYTYQWEMGLPDDQPSIISAGLNGKPTLSFKVEEYDYDYVFRCVVTDAKGEVAISSNVAVREPGGGSGTGQLSVSKQPADYTMKSESDIPTFETAVTGGKAPYNFVWYEDLQFIEFTVTGSSSSGANKLTAGDADQMVDQSGYDGYVLIWCEITDADGAKVKTKEARLYGPSAPTDPLKITKEPSDWQLTSETDIGWFEVEVSGGKAPYTYNWMVDMYYGQMDVSVYKETVTGTDSEFFITDPAHYMGESEYDGFVYVCCEITDANNTRVKTNYVKLIRYNELKITAPTSSLSVAKDKSITLKPTVTGGIAPYTYEWDNNGVISSATGSSYQFSGAYSTGIKYVTVTVTDKNGDYVTYTWTITVTP